VRLTVGKKFSPPRRRRGANVAAVNEMTVKLIHLHRTFVKNDYQIRRILVEVKQTRQRKIAVNGANPSVGLRHQLSQREIDGLEFKRLMPSHHVCLDQRTSRDDLFFFFFFFFFFRLSKKSPCKTPKASGRSKRNNRRPTKDQIP